MPQEGEEKKRDIPGRRQLSSWNKSHNFNILQTDTSFLYVPIPKVVSPMLHMQTLHHAYETADAQVSIFHNHSAWNQVPGSVERLNWSSCFGIVMIKWNACFEYTSDEENVNLNRAAMRRCLQMIFAFKYKWKSLLCRNALLRHRWFNVLAL